MYIATVSSPHALQVSPSNAATHFSPLVADLQWSEAAVKIDTSPVKPDSVTQSPFATPTLLLADHIDTQHSLLVDAGRVNAAQALLVASNAEPPATPLPLPAVNTDSDEAITSAQIGLVSMLVNGPVIAQNGDLVRPLYEGAPIHLNDTIMTSAESYVKITLQDGTVFQLGPLSRATLEIFVLKQDSSPLNSEFTASVDAGLFRFVRDSDKDDDERLATIYTPSATLHLQHSEIDAWIAQDGSTTLLHTAGFVDVSTVHQNSHLPPEQPGSVLHIPAAEAVIQSTAQADVEAFRQQLAPLNPHQPQTPPERTESSAVALANTTENRVEPNVAETRTATQAAIQDAAHASNMPSHPADSTSETAPEALVNTEAVTPPAVSHELATPVTVTQATEAHSRTPQAPPTHEVQTQVTQTTPNQSNHSSTVSHEVVDNAIETAPPENVETIALLDTETELLNHGHRRGLEPHNTPTESHLNTANPNTALENNQGLLDTTEIEPPVVAHNHVQVALSVNQPLVLSVAEMSHAAGINTDNLHLEVGNGEHGDVSLHNGVLQFKPETDFVGIASFEYEVTAPGYTARAVVLIEIMPAEPVQAVEQPSVSHYAVIDDNLENHEFFVPNEIENNEFDNELENQDSTEPETPNNALQAAAQQEAIEPQENIEQKATDVQETTEPETTEQETTEPETTEPETTEQETTEQETTEQEAANTESSAALSIDADETETLVELAQETSEETRSENSAELENNDLEDTTAIALQDVLSPDTAYLSQASQAVDAENNLDTLQSSLLDLHTNQDTSSNNLALATNYINPISSDTLLTPAAHLDLAL